MEQLEQNFKIQNLKCLSRARTLVKHWTNLIKSSPSVQLHTCTFSTAQKDFRRDANQKLK